MFSAFFDIQKEMGRGKSKGNEKNLKCFIWVFF